MPRPRSRVRFGSTPGLAPAARLTPQAIPSVEPWLAGEMFVSPHLEERRRGFALLVGSEAVRRSPLTQHLLASRVDEPDLVLRAQIVQALADYFEVRIREYRYPPEVRAGLAAHLRKYDRLQLLALVESWLGQRSGHYALRPDTLAALLERVPNASQLLTRLVADKTVSVDVRCAAAEVIGQVGFVDALEPLSGLMTRLEGRRAGQLTLLLAAPDNPDDAILLPTLKETVAALKEHDL